MTTNLGGCVRSILIAILGCALSNTFEASDPDECLRSNTHKRCVPILYSHATPLQQHRRAKSETSVFELDLAVTGENYAKSTFYSKTPEGTLAVVRNIDSRQPQIRTHATANSMEALTTTRSAVRIMDQNIARDIQHTAIPIPTYNEMSGVQNSLKSMTKNIQRADIASNLSFCLMLPSFIFTILIYAKLSDHCFE